MKTQTTIITLSAALAVALLASCGEQKPKEPVEGDGGTTTGMIDAAKPALDEAAKAVEAVKPAAEKAVAEVKETATSAMNDATAKANGLIDQAKKLIGENKYSDALNIVQQLSAMKLNPDQTTIVAGLKDQIQKAMAATATKDAAGAAGGLLKK